MEIEFRLMLGNDSPPTANIKDYSVSCHHVDTYQHIDWQVVIGIDISTDFDSQEAIFRFSRQDRQILAELLCSTHQRPWLFVVSKKCNELPVPLYLPMHDLCVTVVGSNKIDVINKYMEDGSRIFILTLLVGLFVGFPALSQASTHICCRSYINPVTFFSGILLFTPKYQFSVSPW